MMKVEVKCDTCGADLSSTGNCVDYRLVLASESLPSEGGVVTMMHIPNPMPAPVHFCGKRCLRVWVLERVHEKAPNIG